MTGMKEGSTYYVWAVATHKVDKSKTETSKNFIKINTSHAHYGNYTKPGGCYSSSGSNCSGNLNYVKHAKTNSFYSTTTSTSRKCAFCGTSMSKGTTCYYGTRDYMEVMCLGCGATAYHDYLRNDYRSENTKICSSCHSKLTSKYKNQGYIDYLGAEYSNKTLYHTRGACTASQGVLKHGKTYALTCNLTVRDTASSVSIPYNKETGFITVRDLDTGKDYHFIGSMAADRFCDFRSYQCINGRFTLQII